MSDFHRAPAPGSAFTATSREGAALDVWTDPSPSEGGVGWVCYARPQDGVYADADGCELHLVPLDPAMPHGPWRVATIYNHLRAPYVRRGIGPALLLAASAHLGVRLCSSVTGPTPDGEWRSPDADRVWDAFRERGWATYAPTEDRWWLDAPRSA